MSGRKQSGSNLGKSKSSAKFLVLKYALAVTLMVNLVNLVATLPIGLADIDASKDYTIGAIGNLSQSHAKNVFVTHLTMNILVLVFGLVGVTKQQFKMLFIVTVLMAIQSGSSFFFVVFTKAILVAIAINILTTILMGVFAYLCRTIGPELLVPPENEEAEL